MGAVDRPGERNGSPQFHGFAANLCRPGFDFQLAIAEDEIGVDLLHSPERIDWAQRGIAQVHFAGERSACREIDPRAEPALRGHEVRRALREAGEIGIRQLDVTLAAAPKKGQRSLAKFFPIVAPRGQAAMRLHLLSVDQGIEFVDGQAAAIVREFRPRGR